MNIMGKSGKTVSMPTIFAGKWELTDRSPRFTWNYTDTYNWCIQTLIFLAPFILALIPVVIEKLPKEMAYGTVLLFVLNRITDALRRWYAGQPKV